MDEGDNADSTKICSVCKDINKVAIYRCPGCLTRTCSLACCLLHKEQTGCNGRRNRVGYVPLNKYSDSTLSNDYHFLEDILTTSEKGKRLIKDMKMDMNSGSGANNNPKRRKLNSKIDHSNDGGDGKDQDTMIPIQPLLRLQMGNEKDKDGKCDESNSNKNINPILPEQPSPSKSSFKAPGITQTVTPVVKLLLSTEKENELARYPPHKQRLVRQAHQRGITLLLMAPGMQRHLMNKSTKYDAKKDLIHWKVEFIIHSFTTAVTDTDADADIDACSNTKSKSSKITLSCDRVSEKEPLSNHVSNLFARNTSHSAPCPHTRSTLIKFFCNSHTSSSIDSNTATNTNTNTNNIIKQNVCALMKRIPCKSSQPSYRRINLNEPLVDILKGMSVIEFPTIEVVLEEDLNHFPVFIQEM